MNSTIEPIAKRLEMHFGNRVLQCYIDRPTSLYGMLCDAVQRHPAKEALVCGETRLTWEQLDRQIECFASMLINNGLRRGDRVAILLGNRIEFVVASLAVSRQGAMIVPISTREQAPGMAHLLNDSGASLLIFEEENLGRLPSPKDTPTLARRINVDDPSFFNELVRVQANVELPPPEQVNEEDTAAILYTSGTTGKPKGAMLTHLNIIHSAMHYQYAVGLSSQDRMIAAVPLSHVTGLVALMATALRCAASLIIMPAFKAAVFLELASRERMTYTLMVPAMYNLCLLQSDCSQYDLSSWRIGAFGGAIMPEATIETVARLWPSLSLLNVYGATETCSPSTIMPAGEGRVHLDSVGKTVPCGEILIMDDDGRQVPTGQSGELWIRGPMVVKGYWNNPDATREGFIAGFWRSGDIGSIDEQGFVSVFDRKKDMINRGGYKIYSSEVENVLCQHPGVFECAVIGKPCPVLGERVHAFVVTKEPQPAAEELAAFCKARLTNYQVPESFTLRAEPLPRNPNGKLLKRELKVQIPG